MEELEKRRISVTMRKDIYDYVLKVSGEKSMETIVDNALMQWCGW